MGEINVDNTEKSQTVLSLCTGYGGLEKGIESVIGKCTVLAHVEIEAFAITNLVNKMETGQMDPVPIWTDLKTFDARPFRDCVDILTGGYPCQPFSAAGNRNGKADPRHLWPFIETIIFHCRPRQIFLENVEGHLSLGISEVLEDLEAMGYRVEVGIFSAVEVGAPHQRKRVFILANAGSKRLQKCRHPGEIREDEMQTCSTTTGSCDKWPARPGETQHEWEEPRVLADSGSEKRQRIPQPERWHEDKKTGKSGWAWSPKPKLGRTIDGAGHRVDRLRLLGNGVVWRTAMKAYSTLSDKLYHDQ